MDNLLWAITAVLPLTIAGRLFALKIAWTKPYDGLLILCIVIPLTDALRKWVPHSLTQYTDMWEATLPVLLAAHIFACVRTYRATVDLYPAIGNYSLRIYFGCVGLAALAMGFLVPWELARIHNSEFLLRSCFLAYQTVDWICGGSLLFLAGYFARYPVDPLLVMPKNLRWHARLLAPYFLSYALVAFLHTRAELNSSGVHALSLIHFGLVAGLYLCWLFGMTRTGEERKDYPAFAASA